MFFVEMDKVLQRFHRSVVKYFDEAFAKIIRFSELVSHVLVMRGSLPIISLSILSPSVLTRRRAMLRCT